MKKNLHFFHLTILPAHILQEGFPHIVIEPRKSYFLQWNLSDIEFIQLKLRYREGKVSGFGPDMTAGVLEVFHRGIL